MKTGKSMCKDAEKGVPYKIDISGLEWARAVHNLQRNSYQIEAGLIDFQEIPPLIESLEQLMNSGEVFFVLGSLAELKGMIAIEPDKNRSITISRLCVNPEFLRQGLASDLIGYILKSYRDYPFVKVSTGAANQPAIDCYQKAGFTIERHEFLEKHQLTIVHLSFQTA
jgi:ribosomal protein S18 acetylase RimI-like enzyme